MKEFFTKIFSSLSEILRFSKIRTRLFISLLILSFIPLVITGIIAYSKSKASIHEKVSAYSSENMKQIAGNVDTAIKKFEGYISDIALSLDVMDGIDLINSGDKLAKVKATQDMIKYLTAKTVSWGSPLYEIYVTEEHRVNSKPIEDNIPGEVYRSIVETTKNSNGTIWTMVQDNKGNYCLLVSSRILRFNTDEVIGVVTIVVNPNEFSKIFRDINIGEGSSLFMLDTDGVIIASGDDSLKVGSVYDPVDLTAQFDSEQKPFDYVLQNGKNLVSYSRIGTRNWYAVSTVPYTFLNEESNDIRNVIIIIAVLCLLVALLMSLVITRSISEPLKRLIRLMSEAKAGNLAINLQDRKKDEISEVISHFNSMVKNFRELLTKVSISSDKVLTESDELASYAEKLSTLSGQVASMMQQISSGAQDQAEGVNVSVTCMSKLDENIKLVEDKMYSVYSAVSDTKQLSENALVSVGVLNEKADITRDAAGQITENINELHSFMQEIKKILKIITGISEQTNLLSLNASIEAARAGAYGYGFAVVAEEIKKLADQSKSSSNMIHEIITKIQNKTDQAVKAAKNSSIAISEQMEALRQTDESFKLIHEAMEQMIAHIGEINSYIVEVTRNRIETLDSMQNISAVIEESASATQEVSAASQEQMTGAESVFNLSGSLRSMAYELKKSVSYFRID